MEIKYVVITEIGTKKETAEWWESQMNIETYSEIFDSFTEASNNMREMVKQLVMKSDCFPLDEDYKYKPLASYLDNISDCLDADETKNGVNWIL